MILEGNELDDVQQPHQSEAPIEGDTQTETPVEPAQQPAGEGQTDESQVESPHPLEPGGDRFKQVWARSKKAEERANQLEQEMRAEREERIRLEERLKVQEEAKQQTQPQYSWEQLQAAVDAGQLTFAKALEIRDAQLFKEWEKKQQVREQQFAKISTVSTEMAEYKKLVPNVTVPGSTERQKVEQEFGYLVQLWGRPDTKEKELAMELAAARAAFGDLHSLKTKQQLSSKPLEKEPFMDTPSKAQKQETKKDFRSTLSTREVKHYERMIEKGRYPGGWADVEKEYKEYETYKSGA